MTKRTTRKIKSKTVGGKHPNCPLCTYVFTCQFISHYTDGVAVFGDRRPVTIYSRQRGRGFTNAVEKGVEKRNSVIMSSAQLVNF